MTAVCVVVETDGMDRYSTAIATLSTTEDFMEGLQAFIQKRPPNWTGLSKL